MGSHNGDPNRADDHVDGRGFLISRRNWLYLAGGSAIGGSLLASSAGADGNDHPNTIRFDGSDATAAAEYAFGVTDSVEPHGDVGLLEVDDTIDGASVTGVVQGDEDAYRFAGNLTHLDVSGGVQVSITYADVAPAGPDRLEIVRTQDSYVPYAFTATDVIEKVVNSSDTTSEDHDSVADNGDGTWTAEGVTGDGWGDSYDVRGEVTSFEPANGEFTLLLNGQEVSVAELTGGDSTDDGDATTPDDPAPTHVLEIVRPEETYVDYTFTTTGEIAMVLDNGDRSAEESNDAVTDNGDGTWTVDGVTGEGFGDTYEFEGEATAFDPKDGEFALYLDGTQVTAYELIGQDPPSTPDDTADVADGGPIGGGRGYPGVVDAGQADVTATSRGELSDALSAASSGDVVFVPGNVELDLGSDDYDVPDGVTLASNRGVDGAPGALLYTDEEQDELFHLHGSARLTGLRVRGPHPGSDTGGSSGADGVETLGPGEVDNCDVYGFSHAAIKTEAGDGAHIHHNVIRENNKGGLGYGVSAQAGHPVIEYNYFNFNRHSVASPGTNHGYTCRYNHFGPDLTDTPMDVHEPGGVRLEVHNNVVEGFVPNIGRFAGEQHQSVQVRGVPDDVAAITDNWFWNPDAPRDTPSGWTDEAIIQPLVDEWTNVTFSGNAYGEGADVTFGDVIPGYTGQR